MSSCLSIQVTQSPISQNCLINFWSHSTGPFWIFNNNKNFNSKCCQMQNIWIDISSSAATKTAPWPWDFSEPDGTLGELLPKRNQYVGVSPKMPLPLFAVRRTKGALMPLMVWCLGISQWTPPYLPPLSHPFSLWPGSRGYYRPPTSNTITNTHLTCGVMQYYQYWEYYRRLLSELRVLRQLFPTMRW